MIKTHPHQRDGSGDGVQLAGAARPWFLDQHMRAGGGGCGGNGGERVVGRVDPKLDRTPGTLVINGLWLEDPALDRDEAFAEALAAGMTRFLRFLDVTRLDVSAIAPIRLRRRLKTIGGAKRRRTVAARA